MLSYIILTGNCSTLLGSQKNIGFLQSVKQLCIHAGVGFLEYSSAVGFTFLVQNSKYLKYDWFHSKFTLRWVPGYELSVCKQAQAKKNSFQGKVKWLIFPLKNVSMDG